MVIRVIDDYVILVDPYNYTLCRDTGRKNKKGEQVYKYISYHGSLLNAVRACREERIRKCMGGNDMSLSEAVTALKRCDMEFEKILKECME